MRTEIAQRLADELRSGRFRQTTGQLAKRGPYGVEHCAYGVLMEMAVADGILDRIEDNGVISYKPIGSGVEEFNSIYTVPYEVSEAYGEEYLPVTPEIQAAFPELVQFGTQWISLSFLNDNKKWSLSRIGDYIQHLIDRKLV